MSSTFEFWLELAWLGTKCKRKGKILLVIEIFLTFFNTALSQSKAKHDQVFSAALLNGQKIHILFQLPDPDLMGRKYGPLDFNLTT